MPERFKSNTPKDIRNFYQTPNNEFRFLSMLYGPFDVDIFADAENHKCDIWFGPDSPVEIFDTFIDGWTRAGLGIPFKAFGNPPYSTGNVPAAVRVAQYYAFCGIAQTTLLIPARVDQSWWHKLVWNNAANAPHENVDIYFFPHRIKFVLPDGTIADRPTDSSVAITFRVSE